MGIGASYSIDGQFLALITEYDFGSEAWPLTVTGTQPLSVTGNFRIDVSGIDLTDGYTIQLIQSGIPLRLTLVDVPISVDPNVTIVVVRELTTPCNAVEAELTANAVGLAVLFNVPEDRYKFNSPLLACT